MPPESGPSTLHARAEEALRQSREQFQTVVSAVSDYAIFLLDPTGHIVSWNAGAERLKGYTAEQIIGQHFSTFYPPDAVAAGWPTRELELATERGRFEDEGWRIRRDGSRFWANVVITPLHTTEGGTRGFVKITRDLTARRAAEEELRAARSTLEQRVNERTTELAQANEALLSEVRERRRLEEELRATVERLRDQDRNKDRFLAILAHELRNPLAPIRSVIELLRHDQPGPAQTEDALRIVERQTLQLTRLVDDLLDMARMTRNAITLERRPCDLRDVLKDAADAARTLARQLHQQLVVRLGTQPLMADADASRLVQVVGNLLHNASKFTPREGTIVLGASRQNGSVVISVSDTGVGMMPDEIERAFGMFEQLRAADGGQQSGLGLGLTLARHIVELHGGGIEVFSGGRGLGSEFRVRLPAAPDAVSVETPAKPRDAVPPRTVLLVDDNVDGIEAMSMILRRSGHDVRIALDGVAALAEAATFQPEVVLLDIGMPGMSGYELAKRLRQMPFGERAILVAITGWGQPSDREHARAAGFDYHMTKPADPAALRTVLVDGRPEKFIAIPSSRG